MVAQLREEIRKYYKNRKRLRNILKETQRALEAIDEENFIPDENVSQELLSPATVNQILQILEDSPAVVILGQDSKAKAKLVNTLLTKEILPLENGTWRWIRLSYGESTHVSLTLNLEYEVVDKLQANERNWSTIPVEDLTRSWNEDANCPTVLDVKLSRPLLRRTLDLFVAPNSNLSESLSQRLFKIRPIFVYALGETELSRDNLEELRELKEVHPDYPVLFASCCTEVIHDSEDTDLTESEQHRRQEESIYAENDTNQSDNRIPEKSSGSSVIDLEGTRTLDSTWRRQLAGIGYSCGDENSRSGRTPWLNSDEYGTTNHLLHVNSDDNFEKFFKFTIGCLQNYLVTASNLLNDVHTTSLRKFILSAFDMARELQITPRRIQYVRQKETELYNNLMKLVGEKQEEVTDLIQSIIDRMKTDLTGNEPGTGSYRRESIDLDGSSGDERREWSDTMRSATLEVRRVVFSCLSERVAEELMTSVDCLRETFVGTLQRCLMSLEKSYEHESSLLASDALKQILSAAYNVELTDNSWSLVHSFLERLRQLVKSLPLPWSSTPTLDVSWRKRVAIDVLNSLNSARLSRAIAAQFRDKVKASHDSFQSALRSLENHYSGRLERTEEQRVAIRKYHAPRLARLALESTSTSDLIRFGIPQQGKEIGRGQYGVVFSCEGWAGAPGPCAIKSVIPPDDKHWNDLAMEFYYTRSIPDHKRIVKLRGSVVDESYGGGCGLGTAVLLVTDRLSRDLYCGIRAGLSWLERIQIAIDVVEGIRYLHSQGLVHRDIKLKNVLLDTENRAKLTDLGFCIPEAMMSGSVVGTPVHMAPELLSGHYDSSVDVYAFGILFWYICAGNVRLPFAFEQFHNKEQLWTSVRKGLRPERLEQFDDECWTLMEQCWAGEPSKRPLLGAVLPVLESVRQRAEEAQGKCRLRSDSLDPSERRSFLSKSPAILALTQPFNQRGIAAYNSRMPKQRGHRILKHPIPMPYMTSFFQTSTCPNLYIQMREF